MNKNSKQRNEVFAANLRACIDRWKKKTGKSQEYLAEKVGVSRKMISNYRSAVSYPEPYAMKKLCRVLETTEEELTGKIEGPLTRYRYDDEIAQKFRNGYDHFCSGIGLDNNFLKFVRVALPDSAFPLFTPVQTDLFADRYIRKDPIETKENHDRPEQQIVSSSGIHSDLTYPDYAFLKDVQDKVTELIDYLYYKRKKELELSLEKVNAECFVKCPDGLVIEQDFKKKICEYDPYYHYWLGDAGKIIEAELKKEGKLSNGKH